MIVPESTKIKLTGYLNGIGFGPSSRRTEPSRSTHADDAALVREAQRGNTAAFEELVHQYDRAVLRLAVHLTGSEDDGQDIYQEAFLRAYINLNRFRFESSFYTWIYRIVTNLCLDHLRKKQSRGRYLIRKGSSVGEHEEVLNRVPDQRSCASPERSLVGTELRECIRHALGRLSPRERMVFELKHYHGLSLLTVAGLLNTTESTIKNTLFRATHKLRLQLSDIR